MKLQLLLAILALAVLIVACSGEPAAPDPEPPGQGMEDAATDNPVDDQTLTEIDGLVTELDELDAELDFSDLDALDEELDFN